MYDLKSESTVALVIGCGKQKIWQKQPRLGPVAAGEAYTGPLFRASRRYAEKVYPGNWFILSAKFGLIYPETQITNYDVTLGSNEGEVIPPEELRKQCESLLGSYDCVVSLASRPYNLQLARSLRRGQSLELPLASLSLFGRMKWLARAASTPANR